MLVDLVRASPVGVDKTERDDVRATHLTVNNQFPYSCPEAVINNQFLSYYPEVPHRSPYLGLPDSGISQLDDIVEQRRPLPCAPSIVACARLGIASLMENIN